MKLLFLLGLLIFAVNGDEIPDQMAVQISPKFICYNSPSGSTYPNAYDCTQFILCVNGNPVVGSCPPYNQYFDPCTSSCTYHSGYCFRSYCYETTTYYPWTEPATTNTDPIWTETEPTPGP